MVFPYIVLALLTSAAIEASEVCHVACATDEVSHVQAQLRKMGSSPKPGFPMPIIEATGDEAKILAVIEKHFHGIKDDGSYLESNRKADETWKECTSIDWSVSPSVSPGTKVFTEMEKELGILEYCDPVTGKAPNNPTCLGIYATQAALVELASSFEGPAFVNATVTKWGKYDSFAAGTISEVSYAYATASPGAIYSSPPEAFVRLKNGTTGFALCDIVRTVLTQSPNQYDSPSCSWQSQLAALSHKAPVRAMKMAVQLLWTGRANKHMDLPCSIVLQQQPGLVPWQNFATGTWNPSDSPLPRKPPITIEEACGNHPNKPDCVASYHSGQHLPIGLVFEWYAGALSSMNRAFTGDCTLPTPPLKLEPALKMDPDDEEAACEGVGTYPGHQLWFCNRVIDPLGGSCKVLWNRDLCGPVGDAACEKAMFISVPPLQKFQLHHRMQELMSEGEDPNEWIPKMAKNAPGGAELSSAILAIGEGDVAKSASTWPWLMDAMDTPSATEDMLRQACKAKFAVVAVYSKTFNQDDLIIHAPKQNGSCGHSVALESCDFEKDQFMFVSWGKRFRATKNVLLGKPVPGPVSAENPALKGRGSQTFNSGIICSFLIADDITA